MLLFKKRKIKQTCVLFDIGDKIHFDTLKSVNGIVHEIEDL